MQQPHSVPDFVKYPFDFSKFAPPARGGGPFTVNARRLLKESDEPIAFLVQNLFQKTGLACLAGSSDTGKSCLLRQLAIAVASGEESFLGWQLNAKHRSAIYVTTEDGREATRFLLRQQTRHCTEEKLENLRFVFDDEQLFPNLDAELAARPADLVVIDCFQDAYGGDLKDSQRIRMFLHPYQLLAEKHQCLFLFLHHTGKRTEQYEPSKNNLLSGQGFEAKMRLVIELRADLQQPNRRHLCIVKGNYLPARDKRESFVLDFDEQAFLFTTTGKRMPFELLVKPSLKDGADHAKTKYLQAKALRAEGLTYQQIAERMGYTSRSSITAIFKKAHAEGWEKADVEAEEESDETGA